MWEMLVLVSDLSSQAKHDKEALHEDVCADLATLSAMRKELLKRGYASVNKPLEVVEGGRGENDGA